MWVLNKQMERSCLSSHRSNTQTLRVSESACSPLVSSPVLLCPTLSYSTVVALDLSTLFFITWNTFIAITLKNSPELDINAESVLNIVGKHRNRYQYRIKSSLTPDWALLSCHAVMWRHCWVGSPEAVIYWHILALKASFHYRREYFKYFSH